MVHRKQMPVSLQPEAGHYSWVGSHEVMPLAPNPRCCCASVRRRARADETLRHLPFFNNSVPSRYLKHEVRRTLSVAQQCCYTTYQIRYMAKCSRGWTPGIAETRRRHDQWLRAVMVAAAAVRREPFAKSRHMRRAEWHCLPNLVSCNSTLIYRLSTRTSAL